MKAAKIKDIIASYQKSGIKGVKDYFSDSEITIYENTFEWRIKQWLDSESYKSVKLELETLIIRLKNYET
jgi:hypothetical protein